MAEHQEAKKDEAKPADGAAAAAKPKSKLPLGPILAVVLLIGGGVGLGMFLKGMLLGDKPMSQAEKEKAEKTAKEADHHEESLLHSATEVNMGELLSNVRNQGGRRYIKMNLSLWLNKEAAAPFAGGGGEHGGGGGGGDEIKRILQASLEEHLKGYDLEELTDPNIYRTLDRGFRALIEKDLHELISTPADKPLVSRVVITNLLVQ